jgi:hypothetical protein
MFIYILLMLENVMVFSSVRLFLVTKEILSVGEVGRHCANITQLFLLRTNRNCIIVSFDSR